MSNLDRNQAKVTGRKCLFLWSVPEKHRFHRKVNRPCRGFLPMS